MNLCRCVLWVVFRIGFFGIVIFGLVEELILVVIIWYRKKLCLDNVIFKINIYDIGGRRWIVLMEENEE